MAAANTRPITMLDDVSGIGEGNPMSQQRLISNSTYLVDAVSGTVVDIEGSIDGVDFFQIAQHTLTSAKEMFHISGKPVLFVRANITTLPSGTATVKGVFA